MGRAAPAVEDDSTSVFEPVAAPLAARPVEAPVAAEPVAAEPVAAAPVAAVRVAAEPVADVSVAEHPVVEHPVADVPVVEHPVVDVPVADVPVADHPVVEHPVAHVSVAEQPVAEQPVAEQAAGTAAIAHAHADDDPVLTLQGPPSARLRQLGISLPAAPAPLAAYVPAVRSGDLVFTSGQLPFVAGALPLTGSVGDYDLDISSDEASALARQCAVNALAAVAGVVDLDRVVRVVKVVVYVASAPGFAGQPQVANGASILLEQVFGDNGRHARSAVGVSALPLRSPVEVEVVVQVATDS